MATKWRKKLQELNLKESELSKSISTAIANFKQVESGLAEITYKLAHGDNGAETANLEEKSGEFTEYLEQADEVLVDKITNWFSKRDEHKANALKMQEARRAKKAAKLAGAEPAPKEAPKPTPPTPADPEPQKTPEPTPAPVNEPQPPEPVIEPGVDPIPAVTEPVTEPVKEAKKGSNGWLWVLGGVAAAIGFGALVRSMRE